jgi:hypothetical protein
MTLILPVNVRAGVYVPKAGASGVMVTADGIGVTGVAEDNYVTVDNIGSGRHTFERGIAA